MDEHRLELSTPLPAVPGTMMTEMSQVAQTRSPELSRDSFCAACCVESYAGAEMEQFPRIRNKYNQLNIPSNFNNLNSASSLNHLS
eukprot:12610839-Alexandrium_andersonii.AAC.1